MIKFRNIESKLGKKKLVINKEKEVFELHEEKK